MTIWLSLIVAVVGVGGTLLSQYMAHRRDRERERRDREHDRLTWAREDAARSFELRHTSYADFLTKYLARAKEVGDLRRNKGERAIDDLLPVNYWEELIGAVPVLDMFGTREAVRCARECVTGLQDYAAGKSVPDVFTKHVAFVHATRKDLAIPDDSQEDSTSVTP